MKITQIAFIALLFTAPMMAAFTEEIKEGGNAAENFARLLILSFLYFVCDSFVNGF